MNYYASGGQAHGLTTLKGHQIQTKDGVPSFGIGGWFQKNVAKPVANTVVGGVKAIQNIPGIKQVSDVATQAVRPIDQALVGLDKTIGKAIPGGWGTVGMVAASMIPGAQFMPGGALSSLGLSKTAALTGLGALTGSGVLRPGRSFNLQGAVIGGAAAYGSSKLADYLAAAGGADMATLPTSEAAPEVLQQLAGPGAPVASNIPSAAPEVLQQLGGPGASSFPSVGQQVMSGNFADAARQIGSRISDIPSNIYDVGANAVQGVSDFGKAVISPDTYTNAFDKTVDFGKSYAQNVSDIGSGIKNLATGAPGAAQAAAATGINPMTAAGATIYGATGIMALDEQEKYLEEAKRANAISQAEYDKALAEINRQRDYAQSVVNQSPFNPNPDRSATVGETYYGRTPEESNLYARTPTTLYAMGGSVDDELGGDYSAMGMDPGNLQKGLFGLGYAAGGQPRFLSGGGDGMSDSIVATINNKQPARLADGEFVIPADVVSHLGNGSSKAGAKQLYSMMDRIRTARTGTKKQGKQVNPRKFMPA